MRRFHPGSIAGPLTALMLLLAGGAGASPAVAGDAGHTAATSATGPAKGSSRPVSLSGRLQRFHGHRAGRSRRSVEGWLLTTRGGRRIPLEMAGGVRPRAGADVRVRGLRRGALVVVSSLRRLPGAVASAAAAPAGAKRTAVVMFNFRDDRSRPFTVEEVREAMFTGARSVSAFYAAESHGRLSLTGRDRADGDVWGWLEIDASGAECFGGSSYDWYAKADAAVEAAGGDLRGYDHVVYVHPKVASCRFVGIATLGGGWSSLNGEIGLWVAGHEIGHNYEFEHAGRLYCRDSSGGAVSVGGSCTVGEYDDPYDIMGNRFQRHSSGVLQLQAGWIPTSNLQTVTSSGTFELAPVTAPSTATQVLRIPRSDGRYYWLEFRRPHGAFDDFGLDEPVVNGVTIRIAGGLDAPGITELVDTNPTTSKATRDEPLAAGRSFVDAGEMIRVTTESAGAAGARVRVTLGPEAQHEVSVEASSHPTGPASAPADPAPTPTPAPAPAADASAAAWTPRRASVGGRRLAASALRRADGRVLRVTRRRGSAALDVRFAPGSTAAAAAGRLELRLRGSRCTTDVSLRGASGRWKQVGRVNAAGGYRDVSVALRAGVLAPTTDVRLSCRGSRPAVEIDAAVLRAGHGARGPRHAGR